MDEIVGVREKKIGQQILWEVFDLKTGIVCTEKNGAWHIYREKVIAETIAQETNEGNLNTYVIPTIAETLQKLQKMVAGIGAEGDLSAEGANTPPHSVKSDLTTEK